jgi:hypothetical protein
MVVHRGKEIVVAISCVSCLVLLEYTMLRLLGTLYKGCSATGFGSNLGRLSPTLHVILRVEFCGHGQSSGYRVNVAGDIGTVTVERVRDTRRLY